MSANNSFISSGFSLSPFFWSITCTLRKKQPQKTQDLHGICVYIHIHTHTSSSSVTYKQILWLNGRVTWHLTLSWQRTSGQVKLIIIQDRVGCSWFKCLGLETGQRRKQNPSRSQGDLIVHCTPFARSFTGPEDYVLRPSRFTSLQKKKKKKIPSSFLCLRKKRFLPPPATWHWTIQSPRVLSLPH